MTIETPELTTKEKRKAGLAKARAAKAERAAKAKAEIKFESEDADALRAKRAALLEELAKLPDPPAPTTTPPGTLIKDGLGYDKVPWTPARLREACNKGETIDGVTFGWITVIGDRNFSTLAWNGIVYWFFADVENKIPNVHYQVYRQALEDRRREQAHWQAAANPPVFDGYMSPPHQFTTSGPLEPRGE